MFMAFIATGFTIGLLYCLLGAPYQLAKGILLLNEDDFSGVNIIKCATPFFNICFAEREWGRSVPVVGITSILAALAVIANVILIFVNPTSSIRVILVVLSIVLVLIAYGCSMHLTASILSTTDELYGVKKVFYILFFPLGYFYIGSYLYKYVIVDLARKKATEVE